MNHVFNGLKKKEFFSEISQLANFCDEKLVRNVYYAMIKVMSRELRKGKRVKMPDWGDFYIHLAAPRFGNDLKTGMPRNFRMQKLVKFRADYKVRAYFKAL